MRTPSFWSAHSASLERPGSPSPKRAHRKTDLEDERPNDVDLSLLPAAFPPSRARKGLPKRSFSSGARFATSLSSALRVRSSSFSLRRSSLMRANSDW